MLRETRPRARSTVWKFVGEDSDVKTGLDRCQPLKIRARSLHPGGLSRISPTRWIIRHLFGAFPLRRDGLGCACDEKQREDRSDAGGGARAVLSGEALLPAERLNGPGLNLVTVTDWRALAPPPVSAPISPEVVTKYPTQGGSLILHMVFSSSLRILDRRTGSSRARGTIWRGQPAHRRPAPRR